MLPKSISKRLPQSVTLISRLFYNRITSVLYFMRKSYKRHIYAGIPLNIYIFDRVSSDWYDNDIERGEIKFLKQNIPMLGALIFNIGAHHGVIALVLSKIVGPFGNVIAVEMDKSYAAIANINKINNNASNLSIINAPVADKRKEIYFSNDQVDVGVEHTHQVKSHSTTIDELTQKYGIPSLIYIDIEGYEYNALKGANSTLKNFSPNFCIEVHVNEGLEKFNGSVKRILSFFPINRYKLFISPALDKCKFIPFSYDNEIIENRFYLIALRK